MRPAGNRWRPAQARRSAGIFAELNGTREGQVAEIEQAVVIEGHGRLGQEGMTDDAEADAPVQRVLAGKAARVSSRVWAS